jgi:hypothetical protein
MAWGGALLVAAVVLFWCYLRESQTAPVTSDGSVMALQGWDMLHGNLLLSGWWLADVTFYTFEIPIDAVVEAIHGLNADVVHITAAIVYTLLVLTAAMLARGTARGAEGVIRAVIAAGIMLAPAYSPGVRVLILSPDHTGVGVPILLTLLLVDRAMPARTIRGAPLDGEARPAVPAGPSQGEARPCICPGAPEASLKERRWVHTVRWIRWVPWVPAAACVLLVWAQVDDPLASVAAAAPLAVVCLVRAVVPVIRLRARGRRRRPAWADFWLAVAAVASVELAHLAVSAIKAAGGYSMQPLGTSGKLVPSSLWTGQLHATGENVLILFGADFFDQPTRLGTVLAFAHFAGVTLAACGLVIGIVRLVWRGDRVTQTLTVATLATLAAAAFATQVTVVSSAHEIAVVLPFGAVLAGRTLGPLLASRRLAGRLWPKLTLFPLLGVCLACYLAMLGYGTSLPAAPAQPQEIMADWLVAHHLTSGLGRYWAASSTTLASGGMVHVAPTQNAGHYPETWVTRPSWYDPSVSYANFYIAAPGAGDPFAFGEAAVQHIFGTPDYVYPVGRYVIMVWNKNLLDQVGTPAQWAAKRPS